MTIFHVEKELANYNISNWFNMFIDMHNRMITYYAIKRTQPIKYMHSRHTGKGKQEQFNIKLTITPLLLYNHKQVKSWRRFLTRIYLKQPRCRIIGFG